MNTKVSVVIGANYGDEGKGLVTNLLTKDANKSIVVMTNGGCQRGHTVENETERCVVHHLSAGLLNYADVYFSEYFILNPMQFVKEYEEQIKYTRGIKLYRHKNCRFSLPFDMLLNQIESIYWNTNNTCGMGIYKTIERYNDTIVKYDLAGLTKLSINEYLGYMHELYNKYYKPKLNRLINSSTKELVSFFENETFLIHYWNDCKTMIQIVKEVEDYSPLLNYNNVVFENAQGLRLDWDYDVYYGTPSKTGISWPRAIINKVFPSCAAEVYYTTRTYFTRQGQGELERLNSVILQDETNIANDFQGRIRCGDMNVNSLVEVIKKDADPHYKNNIVITHYDDKSQYMIDELIKQRLCNITTVKDKYGKKVDII